MENAFKLCNFFTNNNFRTINNFTKCTIFLFYKPEERIGTVKTKDRTTCLITVAHIS